MSVRESRSRPLLPPGTLCTEGSRATYPWPNVDVDLLSGNVATVDSLWGGPVPGTQGGNHLVIMSNCERSSVIIPSDS